MDLCPSPGEYLLPGPGLLRSVVQHYVPDFVQGNAVILNPLDWDDVDSVQGRIRENLATGDNAQVDSVLLAQSNDVPLKSFGFRC